MKQNPSTPIRSALAEASSLREAVQDGLAAMKRKDRGYIDEDIRSAFADSLDLDEAMRPDHAQENRWDYLLGLSTGRTVVAIEPHSAKQNAITTVIRKREAAMEHLRPHLKPSTRIAAWLWVASGKVHFADTERARRRLDQNGIAFVGRRVCCRHLRVAASGANG